MRNQLILTVNVGQIVREAVMKRFNPSSDIALMQQTAVWLEVFQNVFGRDPTNDDDQLWDFLFDPKGLNALHFFCRSEVEEEDES